MATYIWEGRGLTGQITRGELEALSEEAVRIQLRRRRITPTKIKTKTLLDREFKLRGMGRRVPLKEMVVFTRQLSTMIDAGLPIMQCLEILAGQQKNRFFKSTLSEIKSSVEGGSTFAESLKKHPKIFDALYCNLVSAGEVGGVLDVILTRLAVHMEKIAKLKRQIKGAMAYPAAVVFVAVVVVIIILWKVIPTFQSMFMSFGGRGLPAPTQFVINLSNFFRSNFLFIFVALILLIVLFSFSMRSEKFKFSVHKLLLSLPVFGELLKKVALARFSRTLGTMISSGVPILDGLDIVAKSAGNLVIQKSVYTIKEEISQGKTMAEPMLKSGVFPNMVAQMVSVGESTGNLDAMLNKVADFYEDEVDATVATLTSLMEPIMIVFLGGLIGGLIVSMYLPIFRIGEIIQ